MLSWNKGSRALKCLQTPALPHQSHMLVLLSINLFMSTLDHFPSYLRRCLSQTFVMLVPPHFPFAPWIVLYHFPSLWQTWTCPGILFSPRITVSHELKCLELNSVISRSLSSTTYPYLTPYSTLWSKSLWNGYAESINLWVSWVSHTPRSSVCFLSSLLYYKLLEGRRHVLFFHLHIEHWSLVW